MTARNSPTLATSAARLSRRDFLSGTASLATAALTGCAGLGTRRRYDIIDTHTHFYDPNRSQGVPWPPPEDKFLYRTVMPSELKGLAEPLGVVGTVVVEASPWELDNQWLLDLAQREPFIWGIVGHLKPGWPNFANYIEHYAKNPLLRGIRTGLWGVKLTSHEKKLVEDVALLVKPKLTLDVLVNTSELSMVARLAKQLPELRIIIDHCANVQIGDNGVPAEWTDGIRALAAFPQVYMKVSGLVEGAGKHAPNAPTQVDFYRPVLDPIWETFGEDRVIFGSNWPVSSRFADYATVLNLVQGYFESKGPRAAEKYFARNAVKVYRCEPRKKEIVTS